MRLSAINGDHDPKISPALYEKPAALFLTCVGNLSEKNAGTGPDAVDTTKANTTMYMMTRFVLFKIASASGTDNTTDITTKTSTAFFLPVF